MFIPKQTIALIALAFFLSGCSGFAQSIVDPEGYTRRTEAAEATEQSAHEAQRAFAESQQRLAEADAERSRSEAARAEAEGKAAEAASRAEMTEVEAWAQATDSVRQAAAQNRTAVIFAIAIVGLLAAWMIWNNTQVTQAAVQAVAMNLNQPTPMLTAAMPNRPMLVVPHEVQAVANQTGLTPSLGEDGRWLLVDQNGVARQRQRLLTTDKGGA